jgi:hypothetical protein
MPGDQPNTKRGYTKRLEALTQEYESWEEHYREISRFIIPRNGRYLESDRNKGGQRNQDIYDSTGTRALRILAAGMMAGMTSPARPWFRLTTPDPELAERQPVKEWLHDVTTRMRDIFSRSNSYRTLHATYEELGAFGTGPALWLEDFDTVIRGYPLTAGEYRLAQDGRYVVDTLYRDFQMTVGQMVGEFGRDNVSQAVRNQYDNGNYDDWRRVVHVIEPRRDRDPGKRDAKNMPWRSAYFEPGGDREHFLRESGFEEFPATAPRWSRVGNDVYGRSPGMEALPDVRQLQHEQKRKGLLVDMATNPPVNAPTDMKGHVDTMPGGVNYNDSPDGNGGVQPIFRTELGTGLNALYEDIASVQQRINETFYADLFLMISNDRRSNVTAREIQEQHEEKLLMLGPVLERLHSEQLDPLIDRTFSVMLRNGLVPPPPPELQGMDLKVEYVSMLAQSQKAVATRSLDRYVGAVASLAEMDQRALDKLATDEVVDSYADMYGVPPETVVGNDQVALIRQQRAQQQQQAAAMQGAAETADVAKTMSETDTEGNNALTQVFNSL